MCRVHNGCLPCNGSGSKVVNIYSFVHSFIHSFNLLLLMTYYSLHNFFITNSIFRLCNLLMSERCLYANNFNYLERTRITIILKMFHVFRIAIIDSSDTCGTSTLLTC